MRINIKTISTFGFGLAFLFDIAYLFDARFEFGLHFMSWGYIVALFIALAGFGINWLINRNNLDFLTAATIGIAVLIKFIFKNSYFNGLLGWLLSAGSSLYFFAIAIRAANLNISSYNRIIALLCIFAGLYQFVASHIVCELIYPLFGYPKWLSIIWNTGYLIGSGSCLLECLQETNS